MTTLPCFKAYDIRDKLGEELNEAIAYRIGRAFGEWLQIPPPLLAKIIINRVLW